MKLIIAAVFCMAMYNSSYAQTNKKAKDSIDNRMKGPKGEAIVIGPGGGRYYWKNGKKVYVAYKGRGRKPKAKK
jgi:hypothetical protein